jgi:hypothetical protein
MWTRTNPTGYGGQGSGTPHGLIEEIAPNILADRLKRLVKSGLLTREDTRPAQRARYSLTEPAIQLVPVFAQLGSWGLRHRPTSSALNARAELLEQGGPALWQEFMHELRPSHLGSDISPRSPSVRERLNAAFVGTFSRSCCKHPMPLAWLTLCFKSRDGGPARRSLR